MGHSMPITHQWSCPFVRVSDLYSIAIRLLYRLVHSIPIIHQSCPYGRFMHPTYKTPIDPEGTKEIRERPDTALKHLNGVTITLSPYGRSQHQPHIMQAQIQCLVVYTVQGPLPQQGWVGIVECINHPLRSHRYHPSQS